MGYHILRCPICGKENKVDKRVKTCGNPTCSAEYRSRNMKERYAPTHTAPVVVEATTPVERDRVVDELKRANDSLLRQLSDAKANKAELVGAVERAAKEAASALNLAPVKPPTPDKRNHTPEIAIAVLSDLQIGKLTPTYSSAICESRIEEFAQKIIKLTSIQRADHPVKELRVYLLGDIVEGELIFPGQHWRIDSSLFRQVVVEAPRIIGNFLRTMLTTFDKVRVIGVVGNHGNMSSRAAKDYHPETNADLFVYGITQQLLANEPRIEWDATKESIERQWYAIDQIGNKRAFLFHGDQIKGGFAGYPWYNTGRKLMGWRTLGDMIGAKTIDGTFDYAFSGHFHTPVRTYLNGITHWGNGTTESSNTYAAEELASAGEPCQWLLFAHPERGVTAEYLVRLGEEE